MICDKCEEAGHYWFDCEEEEDIDEMWGLYSWCDMRRVFDDRFPCECGCHKRV